MDCATHTTQPEQTARYNIEKHLPVFRAVTLPCNRRKGIKLEEIFWEVLQDIANEKGISLGELIGDIEEKFTESKNLTSILRVKCLNWMRSRNIDLVTVTDQKNIQSLLHACPIPSVALSSTKRLYAYNQQFLSYTARGFPAIDPKDIPFKLKLILDTPIETIFARLDENLNKHISVGFAIGIDYHRRLRGTLNVITMNRGNDRIIIGYVEP